MADSYHISTTQIIDHLKNVAKISVDGIIYDKFEINEKNIIIDKYIFPLDYFDIGGVDPNSLILVDNEYTLHRLQMHDKDNVTLDNPNWDAEPYLPSKVRNVDIMSIVFQENK